MDTRIRPGILAQAGHSGSENAQLVLRPHADYRYIGFGGTRTIIIGRHRAAIEIMEKHGADISDRPNSVAAGDTLSGGMRILLIKSGDKFKKLRKALQSHLQPKSIASYHPVLTQSARQHMFDIIEEHNATSKGTSSFVSTRHQDHARRYAAAVVMALAYGKVPHSYEDPEVQAVNRCLTRLGYAMRPGAWKVDVLPFLKYIPGYLNELKVGHEEELGLFKSQLQEVREKMVRIVALHCHQVLNISNSLGEKRFQPLLVNTLLKRNQCWDYPMMRPRISPGVCSVQAQTPPLAQLGVFLIIDFAQRSEL